MAESIIRFHAKPTTLAVYPVIPKQTVVIEDTESIIALRLSINEAREIQTLIGNAIKAIEAYQNE